MNARYRLSALQSLNTDGPIKILAGRATALVREGFKREIMQAIADLYSATSRKSLADFKTKIRNRLFILPSTRNHHWSHLPQQLLPIHRSRWKGTPRGQHKHRIWWSSLPASASYGRRLRRTSPPCTRAPIGRVVSKAWLSWVVVLSQLTKVSLSSLNNYTNRATDAPVRNKDG